MAEAIWTAAKPSCAEYHYASLTSSVFGSCSITTVGIDNDQPVRRSYVERSGGFCNGGSDAGPSEAWDEVGTAQIG